MSKSTRAHSGMVCLFPQIFLIVGFATTAIPSFSQESNKAQAGAAQSGLPPAPIPTASATKTNSYVFPDGKQQFRNYLKYTFGPAAFIRAAVGAGLDQSKPAPPEWDSGAEGYGERYGFRLGMGMMTETAKYSSAALLHQDVVFHKCECVGLLPRTAHVLISPFVAETQSGRTVLSPAAIGAPYAGSFAAVDAWYPARYEPQDAARMGSYSFALSIGANLAREFILPRR